MLNFGRPINQPIWRVGISCTTLRLGCIASGNFFLYEIAGELGGGEGARTPDLRLAKPALCQLSYAPKAFQKGWLRGRDLNPRPLGYEPNELPDCSTPRHPNILALIVGLGRFELPTSRLSGVRSNQLSYRPSASHATLFSRKKEPHFRCARPLFLTADAP